MPGAFRITPSLGPLGIVLISNLPVSILLKCRTILKIKIYHKLQKRIPHLWRCGREGSRGAWLALREQGPQRSPRVASLPTFLAKQESRATGRGLFAAAIRTILRLCFWATDCHGALRLAMTPKYEITAKKDPVFRPSLFLRFIDCRKNETARALRMERYGMHHARFVCPHSGPKPSTIRMRNE